MQVQVSPYLGTPDLSLLDELRPPVAIDRTSLADLFRNSFVYPPHSIREGVGTRTHGFEELVMGTPEPRYAFPFSRVGRTRRPRLPDDALVPRYHRLLGEAITASTSRMQSPWLLQSGGKDSTTLAIALAETRPDTTCLTYLGGREEDELQSAAAVARTLGLRHENLVCEVGRAYDRYLAVIDRFPLLTADFALLSYVDLATEIRNAGGDGIIDGLGSDSYFGIPSDFKKRLLILLARGWEWPARMAAWPLIASRFELCFLLGSVAMTPAERQFPGSRFTDTEVNALLGMDIAPRSRSRLSLFEQDIPAAATADDLRTNYVSIAESAAGFAKGVYTAHAMGLGVAYPFCDHHLCNWVHHEIPSTKKFDPVSGHNKVLVREHIATRFAQLPYVSKKGSFRFDLTSLAGKRFEQVRAFADAAKDVIPGAPAWLDQNRKRLGNKYHASKFYLLAVVLPWILRHHVDSAPGDFATEPASESFRIPDHEAATGHDAHDQR